MSTKDQNTGTGNGEESRPLIVGGGQQPNPTSLKSNLAKTRTPADDNNNGQPTSATSPQKQIVFRTGAAAAAAANLENRFQVDKVNDNDDDNDSEDSEDSYGEGLYGSSGAGYATKNLKSFRHYTREALPRADHYRNVESVHGFMARPTLDELHGTQATVSFDSNTVCIYPYLFN
ncbi:hypothetical protein BLA29_008088 [Euroglyphus maynei]|uniref:Amino acid permease N-terminal domain-containing protein n=1 Tax=Euroglyphus maynei TaxID=6958 RepID=A0A1Y3B7Z6_EURMA|nr:hypothetical protein BLA29_008088 [Euroglyphus maynei]